MIFRKDVMKFEVELSDLVRIGLFSFPESKPNMRGDVARGDHITGKQERDTFTDLRRGK